jgi:transcriptional regulator with XRE-family HTH domain
LLDITSSAMNTSIENYGDYIKALRASKDLTLREVEKLTNVSNAYLSQLESGKIKQPSPITLHKLAEIYGIKYELLMEKVGYPVPNANAKVKARKSENVVLHRFGEVSREEEMELLEYLRFIRSRRK